MADTLDPIRIGIVRIGFGQLDWLLEELQKRQH